MSKKLDFQASISDVKQVNPLFSTCRVRVLYTGKNRNMSIITRDAVEKALPTLKNIPIVGEYSEVNGDFKGHGGKIDLDSYKYVHTTKPYGVVPESAKFSWEEVKGKDGSIREYLAIDGCYLWTGRYEEAYNIIDNGKGQSMEIEVVDGNWNESQEAYQINDFVFSALCILGDDVEPAFEDANITVYSFEEDEFKKEFSLMMSELESSLKNNSFKEDSKVNLEELLAKYSISLEELEAEGINYKDVSLEELEASLKEFAKKNKKKKKKDDENEDDSSSNPDEKKVDEDPQDQKKKDETLPVRKKDDEDQDEEKDDQKDDDVTDEDDIEDKEDEKKKKKRKKGKKFSNVEYEELLEQFSTLQSEFSKIKSENKKLLAFKEAIEAKSKEEEELAKKKEHENNVKKLFADLKLTDEDVKGLDIHAFSLEEIEEKCYAILGRKMATKKNFSRNTGGIHLPLLKGEDKKEDASNHPYGSLFEKYN